MRARRSIVGEGMPSSDGRPKLESMSMIFSALREEHAVRNDAQMKGGQAVSAASAVCALAILTRNDDLGFAMLALALLSFAFFSAGRTCRGRTQEVLIAITPAVALSLPAIIVLGISLVAGPEVAFTTWLAPGLIAFLTTLSVLRLEPWRPIVYAGVAATQYVAVYALTTWDLTWAQRDAVVTLSPSVQVVRVVFFLGTGIGMALIARALRDTLSRAEKKANARMLFGKYRLGKPIATGGMATVVEATYCPEGGFERPVAVKRVHAHLATNPRVVNMFRAEAELGARLAHPNIVAVLDFGRIDDTYFIAMEHVAGIDLRKMLARLQKRGKRMPTSVAAFIACEVLSGLSFAHGVARDRKGRLLRVVHRDLSPGNVLLSTTGDVKVTDFGLATKLFDEDVHQTKRIVGSMAYLSPEQAGQAAFDHRADLFAVAVLLYEMLTIEPLFVRDNTAATLMAILHDRAPPVPATLRGARFWDRFFKQALSKDPQKRFANAKEMIDAISRLTTLATADELAAFLVSSRSLIEPRDDEVIREDSEALSELRGLRPARPAAAAAVAAVAARNRDDESQSDSESVEVIEVFEHVEDDFADVAEQETHVYTENQRRDHERDPARTVDDSPRVRRLRGTAA